MALAIRKFWDITSF